MSRAMHTRLYIHSAVGLAFLVMGAYCLLPVGRQLANSVAYVTFLSHFAIVYSAAAAIEALFAAVKAEQAGNGGG